MMLKNYFLPFMLLCFLAACNQPSESTPDISQKIKEIPALLDRPEAVWYGNEWADIQNRYGTNRNRIIADPNDMEAYIKLAEVYINEARITGEHGHYYPAALQVLDKALSKETKDKDLKFRALATKAGVQLSLHQFREALKTGQEAVVLNPYNAQIFGVLADANVELGEYSKAVEMADRMMTIRPDIRSYSRISYLREIYGDVPGAIEAMEMAVKSGHPAMEETAWARLTLGGLYEQYDDKNKALALYNEILVYRPNHPFALGAIGNIYLQEKKYKQAEEMLTKAMGIIPEVGFYVDMAKLYKATEREEEAAQMTGEILDMIEDDLESGHNMNLELVNIYAELKDDYGTALKYGLTEYDIRPKNIDVNRELALLYSEMGDWEKASTHAALAASTNSKHPDLLSVSRAISLR